MAVLSFRKFFDSRADTARDWSQNEIGEFLRAHNLLSQNGVSIGIDRGLSDIGEPWLVFFDTQSQDVFLHVARIKGRCVLVSEPLELRLWASDVTELMQRLDESVRGLIKERDEHNSKVVLHPAARMIMAISAVFLLFKLDSNSNVYAKDDLHSAAEAASRKFESSVMMRVQSVLARMLEAAETPAAMAAVASVLLASEIIRINSGSVSEYSNVDDTGNTPAALAAAEGAVVAEASEAPIANVEPQAAVDLVVEAAASAPIVIPAIVMDIAAVAIRDVALVAPAQVAADAGTEPVVVGAFEKVTEPQPAEAVASSPMDASVSNTLSTTLLQQLLNINWVDAEHAQLLAVADDGLIRLEDIDQAVDVTDVIVAAGFPIAPVGFIVDELSVADLDGLHGQVGYFADISMSGIKLGFALRHFLEAFGTMEIEYAGGDVMIEQADLAGSNVQDLGIWRNEMEDGSTISIIGHADIMHQLSSLF